MHTGFKLRNSTRDAPELLFLDDVYTGEPGPSTGRLQERTRMKTGDSSVDITNSDVIKKADSLKDSVATRQKRKRHPTPNGETSFGIVNIRQTEQELEPINEHQAQAVPSKLLDGKRVEVTGKIKNMKGKKPVRSVFFLPSSVFRVTAICSSRPGT